MFSLRMDHWFLLDKLILSSRSWHQFGRKYGADFMLEGHFTRHLRRMRTLYAERQAALVAEIQQHLGGMLEIQPSEVGMHLVAWLPPGMDDQAAARQAAAHSVDTVPISSFGMEPIERGGLILGYAAVSEHEIRDGVRRLAAALHSLPPTLRR